MGDGYSASGSSSSANALQQRFDRQFGDTSVGGSGSKWLIPVLVAGGLVLALIWLVKK